MRNKADFKAYVYQKAAEKGKLVKKQRVAYMRSAVALSLCLLISGAWFYADSHNKNAAAPENDYIGVVEPRAYGMLLDAEWEVVQVDDEMKTDGGASGSASAPEKGDVLYSSNCSFSGTVSEVQKEATALYTVATSVESYHGEREDIDFATHTALVFTAPGIVSHEIAYKDQEIEIRLIAGDSAFSTYTVLLERELYTQKTIHVIMP